MAYNKTNTDMVYEKTNWETGDVITSEKLNKIEDGIGNAERITVVFTEHNGDITANYTFGEIEAFRFITPTTGNVVVPIIGVLVNDDGGTYLYYQETLIFIGIVTGDMGINKYCFKGENYTYYISSTGGAGRERNS